MSESAGPMEFTIRWNLCDPHAIVRTKRDLHHIYPFSGHGWRVEIGLCTTGCDTPCEASLDTKDARKARGAFFTPPEIARYLVSWAVRSPEDRVFEPSCGEASILLAAAERLKETGANPLFWSEQLQGIEIFEKTARIAEAILRDAGFDTRVTVGDFFKYEAPITYDVVVGNPPFVRYQKFSGAARTRSLEAALAQGVRLSGLANAWAAFVVKAALHVKPEGRLALVLPAELLSVNYAQEVRRFLLRRFSRVRLIMFEERIFPGVLEEVVLLLAEGNGGADVLEVHQTRDLNSLGSVEAATWTAHNPNENEKWTPALVAEDAFATYRKLTKEYFESLSTWGTVYLGAVTGNNRFFALTFAEVAALGLSPNDIVRISPPGTRHLRGLAFTEATWKQLAKEGSRCVLLHPEGEPSRAAKRYISAAEQTGVPKAYKCRMRKPWWRVPLVNVPDLFLTYMNHDRPRFVHNCAQAQILNSLYGVLLARGRKQIGRELLPIACLNSVTLLGSEIVGRAYGGGLLKMEPREADALPLPSLERVADADKSLRNIKPQLAQTLRNGNLSGAVDAVDKIILGDVQADDIRTLRLAREFLFQRRQARGRNVKN